MTGGPLDWCCALSVKQTNHDPPGGAVAEFSRPLLTRYATMMVWQFIARCPSQQPETRVQTMEFVTLHGSQDLVFDKLINRGTEGTGMQHDYLLKRQIELSLQRL